MISTSICTHTLSPFTTKTEVFSKHEKSEEEPRVQ
jgi:hypothetical protein